MKGPFLDRLRRLENTGANSVQAIEYVLDRKSKFASNRPK